MIQFTLPGDPPREKRHVIEILGEDYVVTGDFYRESGFVGMRRLLARKDPPTAVFAASDEMAVGAFPRTHLRRGSVVQSRRGLRSGSLLAATAKTARPPSGATRRGCLGRRWLGRGGK